MSHNIYRGVRVGGLAKVTKNGNTLSQARSLRVRNHSPCGFEWGYGGSGPAQLALAILLEETDRETAERYYQKFKFSVIGGLQGNWSLTSGEVRDWLDRRLVADGAHESASGTGVPAGHSAGRDAGPTEQE